MRIRRDGGLSLNQTVNIKMKELTTAIAWMIAYEKYCRAVRHDISQFWFGRSRLFVPYVEYILCHIDEFTHAQCM